MDARIHRTTDQSDDEVSEDRLRAAVPPQSSRANDGGYVARRVETFVVGWAARCVSFSFNLNHSDVL